MKKTRHKKGIPKGAIIRWDEFKIIHTTGGSLTPPKSIWKQHILNQARKKGTINASS